MSNSTARAGVLNELKKIEEAWRPYDLDNFPTCDELRVGSDEDFGSVFHEFDTRSALLLDTEVFSGIYDYMRDRPINYGT